MQFGFTIGHQNLKCSQNREPKLKIQQEKIATLSHGEVESVFWDTDYEI